MFKSDFYVTFVSGSPSGRQTHLWMRHTDKTSWSDQSDVLSALSKTGCASLKKPRNSAHIPTNPPPPASSINVRRVMTKKKILLIIHNVPCWSLRPPSKLLHRINHPNILEDFSPVMTCFLQDRQLRWDINLLTSQRRGSFSLKIAFL